MGTVRGRAAHRAFTQCRDPLLRALVRQGATRRGARTHARARVRRRRRRRHGRRWRGEGPL